MAEKTTPWAVCCCGSQYAQRGGAEYTTTAPTRVVFDNTDRCESATNCTQANTANWPNVPWDLYCLSTACSGHISPSFFITYRVGAIRTQILTGTTYTDVDTGTLNRTFPATGDGTSRALWMSGISHTGTPVPRRSPHRTYPSAAPPCRTGSGHSTVSPR
jgi:hypothetical protein